MDAEVERALLATFTPEQQQRYEVFRRAHFQKGAMKKVLQTVLGQNVTESSAIVVAGAAKLFVGEMTEKAREIMEERKESGPIRPEHLREAYRRHKHEPSAFKPPKFRERRFV
ncbi:hTAFII28-like protein conserved region-domain-containing protein [Phlyctochytrium arcticum]|nr:hTAFII28-like protein conserved region-domain-containing protein [Phlyctochytrium arcticum]